MQAKRGDKSDLPYVCKEKWSSLLNSAPLLRGCFFPKKRLGGDNIYLSNFTAQQFPPPKKKTFHCFLLLDKLSLQLHRGPRILLDKKFGPKITMEWTNLHSQNKNCIKKKHKIICLIKFQFCHGRNFSIMLNKE